MCRCVSFPTVGSTLFLPPASALSTPSPFHANTAPKRGEGCARPRLHTPPPICRTVLICPRLLWAVKMHILQFSSSSGTSRYSSYKPDHPILLDTHPTLPHLLRSSPGSCAALAFLRILWTALPAPSPPVSRQSGLGYYAFLVSPLFLD